MKSLEERKALEQLRVDMLLLLKMTEIIDLRTTIIMSLFIQNICELVRGKAKHGQLYIFSFSS